MKTILCLVAMLLCVSRMDAAVLKLNGSLEWNVTEPQCLFKLKGNLQNLSSVGTGTLKLVLWASAIPNSPSGAIVGEYTLGVLGGGMQYNDFTVRTPSNVPFINGTFYFTIAVVEFTTAGWRNVMLVPTGTRALFNGNFVGQKKWTIPATPVVAPVAALLPGNIIALTEKATNELNAFPLGWQEKTTLTVNPGSRILFENTNRQAGVDYTYSVVTTSLKGKTVSAGKLVMTRTTGSSITFKNTTTLFFHSPNAGTYKTVVTGSLWSGTLGSSTTWGSFKLTN
jgi:hypothetical protein